MFESRPCSENVLPNSSFSIPKTPPCPALFTMSLYTVRASPGKGEGVFATKDISPGTIIMKDKRIMVLHRRDFQQLDPSQVHRAFDSLLQTELERFMKLHEGQRALPTKLMRIYKANAWGEDTKTGARSFLFLDISKFNHSCVPDAEVEEDSEKGSAVVVALRKIRKGEEVLICKSCTHRGVCAGCSDLELC
jgi:SET domain-containing protein